MNISLTTTISIFFALAILAIFLKLILEAKGKQDAYARAVPATGRITEVGRSYNSGTWGGQDIDFSMEVIPPQAAPYSVKVTWSIEPLSLTKIKAGNEIAIRIDRRDAKKIYSAEQWAWSWSQIPLRYGGKIVIGYLER